MVSGSIFGTMDSGLELDFWWLGGERVLYKCIAGWKLAKALWSIIITVGSELMASRIRPSPG